MPAVGEIRTLAVAAHAGSGVPPLIGGDHARHCDATTAQNFGGAGPGLIAKSPSAHNKGTFGLRIFRSPITTLSQASVAERPVALPPEESSGRCPCQSNHF